MQVKLNLASVNSTEIILVNAETGYKKKKVTSHGLFIDLFFHSANADFGIQLGFSKDDYTYNHHQLIATRYPLPDTKSLMYATVMTQITREGNHNLKIV